MRRTWVLAAFAITGLACDGGWLHERGLRVIREVSAAEGLRLLEDPATVLVRVREDDSRGEPAAASPIAGGDDGLPAGPGDRVVVLAEDADAAHRMAARLSRAGIQDVSVVSGGVSAWQAARRGDAPGDEPTPPDRVGEASSEEPFEPGPRARRERPSWQT